VWLAQATGLTQNSIVTCLHLATMSQDRMDRVIGSLPDPLLQQTNQCLQAALAIP
jgi:mRNA-degrading endonuclease toxin of MazEF toxin-antitoxin module